MSEGPAPDAPVGKEAEGRPSRRVWPTLVTLFSILPAGTIAVSTIVLILAARVMGGIDLRNQSGLQDWLAEISASPVGILIIIAPGQLFFLALAIGAALPSPDPLSKRLGFVQPRYSSRTWALLCLGTPVVQIASVLFAQLFFDLNEPSEHLKMLESLFTNQSGFLGVTLLILFASIMPGLSEELFFRGYVRVGLERPFIPESNAPKFIVAILLPALIFAALHGDLMHATAVLPLGLWFGCIAWWSRSVIPSIIAHLVNNLFAIFSARYATALEAEGGDLESAVDAAGSLSEMTTMVVVGYVICFLMLLAGIFRLIRERSSRQVSSTP
jgi:membrane protease YdiL (CAAX protease family)